METKSPKIEKLANELAQQIYGRSRSTTSCVACGTTKVNPEDFKDTLSYKEFNISKWCQACQNKFFVEDE